MSSFAIFFKSSHTDITISHLLLMIYKKNKYSSTDKNLQQRIPYNYVVIESGFNNNTIGNTLSRNLYKLAKAQVYSDY